MSDDFLRAFAETRAFLLGRPSRIQIAPGGEAVLFLRSGPRDPTLGLFELTVADGTTRELVTPAQLGAEIISDDEKARRERMRITERGFTSFSLSPDGAQVMLPFSGRLFLFERRTGRSRELPVPGSAIDPRFSPDGRRIAFVSNHDLHVVDVDGGSPRQLTEGGSEDFFHGLAEFVALEEMHRFEGTWWSPDSRQIAFCQVDQRMVERFAIADPAHPERSALQFRYPRPGRDNARVRLGVITVDDRSIRWANWDQARYPYLARVAWDSPKAPLALLLQTRDQREAAFVAVEATGETRSLVVESDAAWVNLHHGLPRWLPDGSGFLWPSEASGASALQLRRPDGSVEREVVTSGFQTLAYADSQRLFAVTGGPVGNRIERFALRTDERVAITSDTAEHAPTFGRDAGPFVDTRTAADALPESAVVRADGTRVTIVPSVAEPPPFRVNLELTTAGAFHAALVRPRAFEPGRKYPVVVQVYGGPHALTVKADERQYLLPQWIADRGAIVVSIDNRGTPRRDPSWERAIKGSFGEVPLADQVEALQSLGGRFPELDLERVGIYGWSFGGYMAALAALQRPDIYKVAVAGAPVVDWQDYDTHYTERYLDLPDRNPDGYRSSSLLTHAAKLQRPLLLVHGTADDNVYFFHSLKLADALFRAGRPFSFLPLAGVTHQVPDPMMRERLWRQITDFLFAHL